MKAALFVALVAFTTQAVPPRDTSVARPGTGAIIRGRVISAATNQPLHRVRVTLNAQASNAPSAVTDTRGEYEITNVPTGAYTLTASRSGYLTTQYGQRHRRETGRTIDVRDGQVIDGINLALVRGGVLAGVVADDVGDVYPDVRVEALEFRYLRGRRLLVQAAAAETDDLGHYRLSGLLPGTYYLRAASTDTWESDDGTNTYAYAATYYPGVTASDQAERVVLGEGQQLANLNFGLRLGRAATITGIMRNANGEPVAGQNINLDRATRGVAGVRVSLGFGGSTRTDTTGAFSISKLAPGEYMVYTGDNAASVPVIVSDGDVKHVALSANKWAMAAGSVVSDDGTPLPFASRLEVQAVSADPDDVFPAFAASGSTTVARDGTFRFPRLNGAYLFRVSGLPQEWFLSAVTLNGKPFVDTPLAIRAGDPDLSGLQIALSRKSGRIDGQVITAEGGPASDSTVVVFSADSSRWTLASRFIRSVRPDGTGRFTVMGLPPGTYHAAARDFVAEGQWEDPELLKTVAMRAPRIEVREAEPATVTLKLEVER